MMKKTYLSLGGNIGNTQVILHDTFGYIKDLKGVYNPKLSFFYETSPVGGVKQSNFINAAVSFETTLTKEELLEALQAIERIFKKDKKEKNGPRTLDIDILFYGLESYYSESLIIPHPRWQERLFVLKPLFDLTKTIILPDHTVVDLEKMIADFTNIHQEVVKKIDS
jgi:2-amino-4-hydroxy-6-hydroxymethyldihydropteridine diphosphokinase